jgi:integrase/recombinase XerD
MLTKFPGGVTNGSPDQNPAEVYLASLPSDQSRRTMRAALNDIAVIHGVRSVTRIGTDRSGRQREHDVTYLVCNWAALTPGHVVAIRKQLVALYKPASANKVLSALRGVLRACYNLGLMTAEDYHQAVAVKGVKVEPLPAGRDLTEEDVLALVQACKADKTPAGARDVAMIGVWYTCGLRRSELVRLELADFDATEGRLSIRGGKSRRTVYITGGALVALQAWLVVRGLGAGALFCSISKVGKVVIRPMSAQAVYKRLKKRAEQAGVEDFSPHDFRRTFVGDMLDRGADIATVARLAGYASMTATAKYDRRVEEAKRRAAGLLRFPF